MIIYSIIPPETIFENIGSADEYKFLEVRYKGEMLEVQPLGNNRYKINRLISTSPKSYLDPGFAPGTIITI